MRRYGRIVAGSLVVAAFAGCEMSTVDPDAQVTVRGSTVDGAAQPLAEHDVVLLTEPTASDVLFGLPFGLGSLGFACLVEDPPPPCDTRRRTSTAPDGAFTFTLTGRETQGTFGEAARMTVSSRAPARAGEASGPATTGAFTVGSEQVALEPLTLVRAALSLSAADGRAVVDWAWQADAVRGVPSSAELVFQDGHAPIWVASASPGGAIDLRVLEDRPGVVGVVEHRRAEEGIIDDLTYRSELLAYTSGAGAPVSRGATCRVVTDGGEAVAVSPCPVTDGDLTQRQAASLACDDPACTGASGYEVDLGSARPVRLLVVRGCDGSCPLEVSADGATWEHVAELGSAYVSLARDATAVRYVRVTGDAGVHGLAEVSAWDGPPAAATFAPRSLTADPDGSGGAPATEGDRARGWPVWLAGALVVLAALALGVAIGRRST